MIRPNDWDKVQEFGEYKSLPAGAYVCKIIGAEEVSTKEGKPMLRIALDIVEGEFSDYFRKQFDADARANKRWGCVVNQPVYGRNGETSRGFKTLITSVERSNNMQAQWGDGFIPWLKGKKVGALFRREEYLNANNERKWATTCFSYRSIGDIANCEIPEDKPLSSAPASNGFGGGYSAPTSGSFPAPNNYGGFGAHAQSYQQPSNGGVPAFDGMSDSDNVPF